MPETSQDRGYTLWRHVISRLGTHRAKPVQRWVRPTCPISDYAIIGDCRSGALVAKDGSIDWLCWPCFSSPSVFAAVLDRENGGFWQICPSGPFTAQREYMTGTNMLVTTFETGGAVMRLTDFMPVDDEASQRRRLAPEHQILRVVECLQGKTELESRFAPRPKYGTRKLSIKDKGHLGLRVDLGAGLLCMHSQIPHKVSNEGAYARATLQEGDSLFFCLTYDRESPASLPLLDCAPELLRRSREWWERWSGRCTYAGPYREAVLRSVLTLKLLEFIPSGAFVAALTTSLPERIGGELNFDYRYCWLRDASLTIHALCGTGYEEEAEGFAEWLLHATRLTQPKLMVMYDVYGNLVKTERTLKHLGGYRNSAPVRIGNGARAQIQLDTYGEVICGAARLFKSEGKVDRETARVLIGFGNYVCKKWQQPDSGIWEGRGEPMAHTHSLLLCWVALDELVQFVEKGALKKAPVERFRTVRQQIRHRIETTAWSEPLQSYVSEPGGEKADATLLLMALHNFHEASSARLRGTYKRVMLQLGAGGPLIYRYRNEEQPEEGAFGICGFWGAEHLAMGGGTLAAAEEAFRSLLIYANDVGLLAEETDPETGEALGNFPQGFTHIGLISAALAIERRREADGNRVVQAAQFVQEAQS